MKEPTLICTLSDQQVGMNTTYRGRDCPQKIVRSNYGMAEFPIDVIHFNADGIPQLAGDIFIGNSPFIKFVGGGIYAPLWGQDVQPRAQVAQLSGDETVLYYTRNSQKTIGRVFLGNDDQKEAIEPKVIEPLGPIKGPSIDYFLQLRDGRFAVVESQNPDSPTALRIYGLDNNGTELKLDAEKELGNLVYGLCQDNDSELMVLVPRQGNYPFKSQQEPGVYRVSVKEGANLGDLIRDIRFDEFNLPTDLRSLVPVFGKEGKIPGFLAGDYKFSRTKGLSGCGGNGSIFWLPME